MRETATNSSLNSVDDLIIDFTVNQTAIGKNNGVLANLSLTNQGINPLGNITVDFSLDNNITIFSSKYSNHQEINLLNPTSSVMMNIETILNATKLNENALDLVLMFDASGSMGDEINSVKAEIINLTNKLLERIESLRLGAIVYGWGEYSEYPTESVNNYVELTSEVDSIIDFINTLYAGGSGVEPWGDAFWLINNWEWRDYVPKLAIIIGDEDCDPGYIVGEGNPTGYYNGSQLLNVITSLKEKGVQINSVITGTFGIVENQFKWIANYTGGKYVYLEDLLSGEDPIDLPELIGNWALNMTREFFVHIDANVSWIELGPKENINFNIIKSVEIIIDLTPPSISISYLMNPQTNGQFELEIFIKPKDISDIVQSNIYWTYDDLNGDLEPTWYFKILENKIGEIYYEKFSNLILHNNFSFYITSLDGLYNSGKTAIYNVSISISTLTIGSMMEILFTEDNSTKILFYDISELTGYFWISFEEEIEVSIEPIADFQVISLFTNINNSVFSIASISNNSIFELVLKGNQSDMPIKIKSVFSENVSESNLSEKSWYLSYLQNYLFKITFTQPSPEGYLTLLTSDEWYNPLVAKITIFTESWEKIGTFPMTQSAKIQTGTYYLWIEHVSREGYFYLEFSEKSYTPTDPYYTVLNGIPVFIYPLMIGAIYFIITIYWKRKRINK